MDSYRTVARGARPTFELVDRKSRFIAQLAHVATAADADAFVAEVRATHHDARHNVPVWILADGIERASDDGEPQGTAGHPVLDVLRGAGLMDVCCVVTRYFGGTLLGPGGLVRAYSGAASGAIDVAEQTGGVVVMTFVTPCAVSVPYAWYDRVSRLAADAGGKVRDQLFREDVTLTVDFKAGDERPFVDAVRELASGEDLVRVREPRFAEF